MECLTLLAEARAAGLVVRVDGDRLVIRGPRRAETLARCLLERKAEVMAAITGEGAQPSRPVRVAGPSSRYTHPWPDRLPGLGERWVGPFISCAGCGVGTWVRFGPLPLCLRCTTRP